jgi:crossover junction endodeoxyribonuclease RusA
MTLIVTVPGIPATKGSLRHVGHGRLIEGNKGSSAWRSQVTLQAHLEMAHTGFQTILDGAQVCISLWIPRPKSVRRLLPITRSSGDADKHARNILDALVDARVLADDSRVVSLHVTKAYAPSGNPGAVIRISAVDAPVERCGMCPEFTLETASEGRIKAAPESCSELTRGLTEALSQEGTPG